jgi:hypothetical protein
MGTVFGIVALAILVLVPVYLIWMLVTSIREERRTAKSRGIWESFGLGIVLFSFFLISWIGHGLAHDQPVGAGEFVIQFGEATLQNWQSEFLEAFALVVFTTRYIHRGSAESKDSNDRMEAKIDLLMKKLEASN